MWAGSLEGEDAEEGTPSMRWLYGMVIGVGGCGAEVALLEDTIGGPKGSGCVFAFCGLLTALSHSPRFMSCRCLKFSIQPELPLKRSGEMPNDFDASKARLRMSWSVMLVPWSAHAWRDLIISSSTSGNMGLTRW